MSELKAVLAASAILHYAGKDREIKPLTFNRLILIEDEFGTLAAVDFDRARSQRFLLWVILGAVDPELTEEATGELLTLEDRDKTKEFILSAFRLSGLLPEQAEEAVEAGKPRATKAKA